MGDHQSQEPVEEAHPRATQAETQAPDHPLEVDDNPHEEDSSYGDSEATSSYLSSLKSSVFNYKYEASQVTKAFMTLDVNKPAERTPLPCIPRGGPNDGEEQDRMDLAHHIYRLLIGGKLHLAPIGDSPQRVLDLGTGTGIWAMDFADEYPSADVRGTDLSPIQPKWTPPNCSFEVDDFEADWLYRHPFDFIHGRELEGCLSNDKKLFQQAFKHLSPGGYIELQAAYPPLKSDDDTGDKATDFHKWVNTICDASAKFGKPLTCAPEWKTKLEEVGFVDVHQEIRKVPMGPWPKDPKLKEIGKFQAVQEAQVIDSYTPGLFGRVLGWSEEEIQVFIAKVKRDLKDPTIHLYQQLYFIWGRKPEV
ncbi:Hypothetical protein NCS54_00893300 [Fusarium falciforme]|uniref:Hypothetical protein n=1 Tax=Fusarium falciforme TaxID=195108 RepID=UPI002300A41D|nr:Hypothetical protein NCS54_00893300 [Fusarium falciforme]WAO91460.1 Hypothetical protein NCS54_00893300 [Fusarium falciforme]